MLNLKKLNLRKVIRNPFFWTAIGLIIIFVAYFFVFNGQMTKRDQNDFALKVNEKEFSFDDYSRALNQVRQQYMMQGMNLTDEQAKEMASQSLIQQALLMDFLEQENIEISDKEMDDHLQEILKVSNLSEEEFFSQLKSDGLDDKRIKEILIFEVRLDKYFDQLAEGLEVSEEEIQEAYDQFLAQIQEYSQDEEVASEDIPSFEEIKDQIKQGLIEEKIMPVIIAQLEEMEDQALIIFNLDEIEIDDSSNQMQMLDLDDLEIDLDNLE
jgi:peptidyl-prolyl cis-trans isomerase SurA